MLASPEVSRGLLLSVIVVVAFVARVHHLGAESIWTDEAYSIQIARASPAEIVLRTATQDTSPPLYYLILHGWRSLFGDSPVAARMPSVIAGTLAVLFSYFAAAPLIGSYGALVAALLHAVSPFHVAYSQEARQYALLLCAALASFAALARLMRGGRFALPAYAVATILLCYSHSAGCMTLLAQLVFTVTLAACRGCDIPWRRILAGQAIAVLAFLPWAALSLRQYQRLGGVFWVPVPTLYSIAETFYEYVGSMLLLQICVFLAVLALVRPAQSVGSFRWREPLVSLQELTWTVRLSNLRTTWLLVCWLLIPIASFFVISRLGMPMYLTRATIAASSAFYLLVARGVTRLGGARLAAAGVLALLFSAELVAYYRTTTKEQWNLVASAVQEYARPGDVFVIHQRSRQVAFDYYVTRSDLQRVGFPERRFADDDALSEHDMRAFPEWVNDQPRVWLVLSYAKDPRDLLKNHLRSTRDTSVERRYAGIEIWLFERPPR